MHKKSVIQPSTNVTQDWILSAIKQYEGAAVCSIVNMDFQQTAPVSTLCVYLWAIHTIWRPPLRFKIIIFKGVHEARIEANVAGELKNYSWIVKATAKSNASSSLDTFVLADLGTKLGRY